MTRYHRLETIKQHIRDQLVQIYENPDTTPNDVREALKQFINEADIDDYYGVNKN